MTKKKKYLLIIAIVGLFCMAVVAYLLYENSGYAKVLTLNLSQNHFKTGDSLYINKRVKNDKDLTVIMVYRAIKPINSNAQDQNWQANSTDIFVSKDSLIKQKTDLIGQYKLHRILYFKIISNSEIAINNFYAIDPNKKALSIQTLYHTNVPAGYEYADSLLYVSASDVR